MKTLAKVLRRQHTIDSIKHCIYVVELELCFLGTNKNKGLNLKKKLDIYQNRTI